MKLNFIYLILLYAIFPSGIIFAQDSKNVFTYKVGDIEVTLLVETNSERDTSMVIADNAMIQKYIPEGKIFLSVNTFLVKTPKNTIMVDTGFGTTIFETLKTLNMDASKIDTVLITHMHGDHISGLQKDGKATFPNATIYLSEQEKNYWSDSKMMAAAPEWRQFNFKLAQNVLAIYDKKIKTFNPGELNSKLKEILPGITPAATFGHTPGHTAYIVSSGKDKLLIFGDVINIMNIQIPVPAVATVYDTDPKAAAETRKKVLKYAADNKIPIAGMHLAFPAIGTLDAQNDGGYKFNPVKH